MPGFHIEHVMLKYLINHRCGCSQRSKNFMILAGDEAIAATAQPPDKDNVRKIFLLTMFIKENTFK